MEVIGEDMTMEDCIGRVGHEHKIVDEHGNVDKTDAKDIRATEEEVTNVDSGWVSGDGNSVKVKNVFEINGTFFVRNLLKKLHPVKLHC